MERLRNPRDPSENPTFLPGDKVLDKRDSTNRIWRIVQRTACVNGAADEDMVLREVGDDTNERHILASQIVPYLKMVAMSA
jgi:hypothetical protein